MRRARERGCAARFPSNTGRFAGCPWCCGQYVRFSPTRRSVASCWCFPLPTRKPRPNFWPDSPANVSCWLRAAPPGATPYLPGLAELGGDSSVVLVHDGARPFVERDVIDAVIRHARQGESAIAAIPLSDTLKETMPSDPSRIARTLSRDGLWRAQTPQGFPRTVLLEAYRQAASEGRAGTDDAELVERMGVPVRIVTDSSRNLKITGPEDLALAELLAADSP